MEIDEYCSLPDDIRAMLIQPHLINLPYCQFFNNIFENIRLSDKIKADFLFPAKSTLSFRLIFDLKSSDFNNVMNIINEFHDEFMLPYILFIRPDNIAMVELMQGLGSLDKLKYFICNHENEIEYIIINILNTLGNVEKREKQKEYFQMMSENLNGINGLYNALSSLCEASNESFDQIKLILESIGSLEKLINMNEDQIIEGIPVDYSSASLLCQLLNPNHL